MVLTYFRNSKILLRFNLNLTLPKIFDPGTAGGKFAPQVGQKVPKKEKRALKSTFLVKRVVKKKRAVKIDFFGFKVLRQVLGRRAVIPFRTLAH